MNSDNFNQMSWMADGLADAVHNDTLDRWLIDFFKENEERLREHSSMPIVIYDESVNDVNSFLRSVDVVSDDDRRMIFLINDLNGNVLERFTVVDNVDYADRATTLANAMERLIVLNNDRLREVSR